MNDIDGPDIPEGGNWTKLYSGGDDNYIPQDKLQVIVFVIAVILLPLISFFGSVGNLLSLIVLFHHRMRNATNFILAALAISDLLFLIHSLIFCGINIQTKLDPEEARMVQAKIYPLVGAYGSVVTARITSWLTALISLERFIAVYIPMHVKHICSKKYICIAIAMIYSVTLIMFIPFALKYTTVELVKKNKTITKMVLTNFGKNKIFYKVYGHVMNALFRFVPIILVFVLNSLIIRAIHKSWANRRKMSRSESEGNHRSNASKTRNHYISHEQHRINKMLLTVSFIFLICILPGALNSIATHIWSDYSRLGRTKNLYKCISSVTYLLETFNSSINFIIYMALSKKFSYTYREIFCCSKRVIQFITSFNSSGKIDRFHTMPKNRESSPLMNEESDSRAKEVGIPSQSQFEDNQKERINTYIVRKPIASKSSSSNGFVGDGNHVSPETLNLKLLDTSDKLNGTPPVNHTTKSV